MSSDFIYCARASDPDGMLRRWLASVGLTWETLELLAHHGIAVVRDEIATAQEYGDVPRGRELEQVRDESVFLSGLGLAVYLTTARDNERQEDA